MRVLVVEDEEFLAGMIAEGLRRDAVAVDIAPDGPTALEKLRFGAYDVMILDRDLPGLHGDEVCRQVVGARLLTRILMLTAAGTVRDRVAGLGLGADDYLTKPFAYDELLARVLALGRRSRPALPPVLERAGLTLDTARRQVCRDGRFLALSRKEFAVLETLLRAEGAVVSGDDLIEEVWEEDTSYRTNAVRVTLSKLRTKLGAPPVIETVPGAGYRIGDGPVGSTGSGTAPLPGTGSTAPLPGTELGRGTALPGTGSATP
ncbi:response regulator transcription factor [Streptomyces bacillaris]|uniref:response regulator transcription factor n=1 Tax=Streptomyces bacillaris TaxID=68179 RepID=UPI0035DBC6CE